MSVFSKSSSKGFDIVVNNDDAIELINSVKATTAIAINPKNPKRIGSKAHSRYSLYSKATTVQQFIDNGGTVGDFKYDLMRGFITIKK